MSNAPQKLLGQKSLCHLDHHNHYICCLSIILKMKVNCPIDYGNSTKMTLVKELNIQKVMSHGKVAPIYTEMTIRAGSSTIQLITSFVIQLQA